MNFIALKPCCFAGKMFKIGETIPGELVLPAMQKRLLTTGKIAVIPSNKSQKNKKQAVGTDAKLDV